MSFYRVIKNESGGDGTLYIDGVIAADESWYGPDGEVIARRFRNELNQLGDVTVYINSPGGEVFAGAEIYTALKEHKGRVVGKVTGIAASIASLIAMACDELQISPVGTIMIHDPWSYAAGNAREFAHMADVLREIGEGLINAYVEKTGKTRDEIQQLLAAETYMNAQTAVEEGFADAMMTFEDTAAAIPKQAAKAHAMMQLNRFGPAAVCAMVGGPQAGTASGGHSHPWPVHHTHSMNSHTRTLSPKKAPTQDDMDQERELRAEIASRAEALAICY